VSLIILDENSGSWPRIFGRLTPSTLGSGGCSLMQSPGQVRPRNREQNPCSLRPNNNSSVVMHGAQGFASALWTLTWDRPQTWNQTCDDPEFSAAKKSPLRSLRPFSAPSAF